MLRGESVAHFESIRLRRDGARIDAARQSDGLTATIAAYLQEALKGVGRTVEITERLQRLVPSPRSGMERIRVEIVTRAILPLFEKPVEEQGVTLRLELLGTPAVRIGSSRFGFIVMSLITNSLHAVMDQPVRVVTLRSGADSASVFLEVVDTGRGIPPEVLPRLFKPFFTTKGEWAPGGSAQSRVKGVGSRFRVVLPIEEPGAPSTLPPP